MTNVAIAYTTEARAQLDRMPGERETYERLIQGCIDSLAVETQTTGKSGPDEGHVLHSGDPSTLVAIPYGDGSHLGVQGKRIDGWLAFIVRKVWFLSPEETRFHDLA